MRVLITGDRNGFDALSIEDALRYLPLDTVIIHGGARGVDTLAGQIAEIRGLEVNVVPADWKKLGKAAGNIRNQQMLTRKPDLVLAFHRSIWTSKGTKHMIEIARKAGVPVVLISQEGKPLPSGTN